MRKIVCLILCSILLALLASFVSCSIPTAKPKEGVWYCKELRISIDFSVASEYESMCATMYNDDGTYRDIGCHFDYGSGIFFFEKLESDEIDILNAHFKWSKRNNEFIVTSLSDGTVYVFTPMPSDETTLNDAK